MPVLPPQLLELTPLRRGQTILSPPFVDVRLLDPVADRLGRWFELPRQLLRRPPASNHLHNLLTELLAVLCVVSVFRLFHRGHLSNLQVSTKSGQLHLKRTHLRRALPLPTPHSPLPTPEKPRWHHSFTCTFRHLHYDLAAKLGTPLEERICAV